jgi:histidinol-phosphatase (PHP family)
MAPERIEPVLFDQHLHSWHSMDSETPPRENVLAAIQMGLAAITFTDHFDSHASEWPMCRLNYADYSRDLARLRDEFGRRIFIGQGIEVCFQPERMNFILDYLDAHDFDMILLSVHWSRGKAFHRREHWAGFSVRQAAGLYFQAVLDAARCAGELKRQRGRRVFDVLGHLDLIKRYSFSFFNDANVVTGHEDLIDEILHTCVEADLVPEINTSPLRNQAPEAMPGPNVIQRYAELGGRSVSLGSDAHRAAAIGQHLAEVAASLPSLGISSLAQFKARERNEVTLAGR